MTESKRYLIGYGQAATVPAAVEHEIAALPARYPSITAVRRLSTGQRVFEMDAETASAVARECSNLAVEEDQHLEMCAPDPRHTATGTTAGAAAWGHLAVRADKVRSRFTGRNIRVAVVASGAAAHRDVKIAGGFNTLGAGNTDGWNGDESGLGTHCCGVLMGIAREAEVFAVNVLPHGTLSNLIEAIDWCVEHYIHVIAVCAGIRSRSVHLQTILEDAAHHGLTVAAAAGDSAGHVLYPAACPGVIAVAAIGRTQDVQASSHAGSARSRCGQYRLAPFSSFGPEIQLCAPGSAIVSTVPGGYAARDGTAVACAFVAGIVVLVLEALPELRTADAEQPRRVRAVLCDSAIDLGLAAEAQGRGLVNAALALRSAFRPPAPLAGARLGNTDSEPRPQGSSCLMHRPRLPVHVVHQQILPERVRCREVCLPPAHLGHLLHELH